MMHVIQKGNTHSCLKKKLKADHVLHSCAIAFTLPEKNPTNTISLGSQAMAVLLVATLQILLQPRYEDTRCGDTRCEERRNSKSFVHTEGFRRTGSSTKFHSLRVYYQTRIG